MHTKMIQEVKKDPSVIVADFSKLPEDADFELENIVPVFIKSEHVLIENTPAQFEIYHEGFNEFEVNQSFWDFGE